MIISSPRRPDTRLLTNHVLVKNARYYREVLAVLGDSDVDGSSELRAYFEEELRCLEAEIARRRVLVEPPLRRRWQPPHSAGDHGPAFLN